MDKSSSDILKILKKYSYILVDWDGTLAGTLDLWLEAFRTVLEKRGIIVTDNQIGESFGAFTKFAEAWGASDAQTALQEAGDIAIHTLPKTKLYPGALQLVKSVHAKGMHLALITTSPRANIEFLLKKYGLDGYFEAVITGDEVVNHKPHPEPILKALKLLNGSIEKSIMIGDSNKDIDAAKNAGIDSILFYPKNHDRFYDENKLKEHNPTYQVNNLSDISKIIL